MARANKRLAIALGALVLVLLAADRALAVWWLPGYWRPLPPFGALTNPEQRAWLERERAELARGAPEQGIGTFDRELGWVTRPGSASPDGRVHVNTRGFRGERDYPERPAPGTTRVATFGDSYTFCEEVSDRHAWQAVLEAADPALEVLNLGVGGYGTDQALLRARRELPGLNADVAFLGLLLENVGRNVNRYRPLWYPGSDVAVAKPRFVLEAGRLVLVPLPFATRAEEIEAILDGSVLERLAKHEHWRARYLPRWLDWSAAARMLAGRRAYADRQLPPLLADREGEPYRVTVALLESFVALARAEGIERVAVLVFAMEHDQALWKRDGTRYWQGFLDDLARRGLPVVDLSAPVGAAYRDATRERPLFHGSHHSRLANAIVADELARWLVATDRRPEDPSR